MTEAIQKHWRNSGAHERYLQAKQKLREIADERAGIAHQIAGIERRMASDTTTAGDAGRTMIQTEALRELGVAVAERRHQSCLSS